MSGSKLQAILVFVSYYTIYIGVAKIVDCLFLYGFGDFRYIMK